MSSKTYHHPSASEPEPLTAHRSARELPEVLAPRGQSASSPLTWWAACAFAAILGFSRLSYGLLLPALHADLGASYSTLGLVQTLNYGGYLFGTLLLPLLLPRVRNRVNLNMVALVVMGSCMAASALSLTLWQLAAFRFLIGVASALATVLTMALTLERIEPSQRGQASAIAWTGGMLGIVLSGLIVPPLLMTGSTAGWRLIWIVMGIVGGVCTLGFSLVCSRTTSVAVGSQPTPELTRLEQRKRDQPSSVLRLFLPRHLLFLTLTYTLFGGSYIIYMTFFIPLLEQQGVSAFNVGFIWAAIGAAGALSGWLWGKVLDRWPSGYPLAATLALGMLGALSVLIHNIAGEALGAALFGLAALISPALMVSTLLKRAIADHDYPLAYSVLTALFAAGQIAGPLGASFVVARFGLTAGIATSAVLFALAVLCACGYGATQSR